jgi:hypothetical protein
LELGVLVEADVMIATFVVELAVVLVLAGNRADVREVEVEAEIVSVCFIVLEGFVVSSVELTGLVEDKGLVTEVVVTVVVVDRGQILARSRAMRNNARPAYLEGVLHTGSCLDGWYRR